MSADDPFGSGVTLKVGLFGNLANNAYVLSKLLRKRGIKTQLILDPQDSFALSQPLWEDCDLVLDSDVVMGGTTDWRFWGQKAEEVGWCKPDWIHVGETALSRKQAIRASLRDPRLAARALIAADKSKKGVLFSLRSLKALESLADFDMLLVHGFGPVYARAAGVPFVIIPFGGDLTIAAFQNDLLGKLQRSAYRKASHILIGDPDFALSLERLGLSDRWTYFPFPVDVEKFAPNGDSEKHMSFLSGYRKKMIFFMPSRQDFYWKGTNKALKAFVRLCRERNDVALVTPKWGTDTQAALQLVTNRARASVLFLPYVLSKVRLAKFYHVADVILDQFVLGSYGTTTIEAMACGKTVITDIDAEKYRPHLKRLPPNLQAHTEEEIFEQMKWAIENRRKLAAIGAKSREWVMAEHCDRPLHLLENVIRNET